jgi:hypothetical protein
MSAFGRRSQWYSIRERGPRRIAFRGMGLYWTFQIRAPMFLPSFYVFRLYSRRWCP